MVLTVLLYILLLFQLQSNVFTTTKYTKANTRMVNPDAIRDIEDVLQACNLLCDCTSKDVESVTKIDQIVCDDIWKVQKLSEFDAKELEGATLEVSDQTIQTIIVRRTANNQEQHIIKFIRSDRSGLKNIKQLVFRHFPSLIELESGFFNDIFPSLESLYVGNSKASTLNPGKLINLKEFIVHGSSYVFITCADRDMIGGGCFHPEQMDRVEIDTKGVPDDPDDTFRYALNIEWDMFPDHVTDMKIVITRRRIITNKFSSLINIANLIVEVTDIQSFIETENIIVTNTFSLKYTVTSLENIGSEYQAGISTLDPVLKKKQPYIMLTKIYNNPSLKKHLVIVDFPSKTLPVIMSACLDCKDADKVLAEVVNGDLCAKERALVLEENPTDDELIKATEGTIIYRGFTVDLTELIDKIGSNKPELTLIIYAYNVHISHSRKIGFNLQVYYTVLQTKFDSDTSATHQVIYKDWSNQENPTTTSFSSIKASAYHLSKATEADAIFMQAYAKCTVSAIALYREKSSFTDLLDSKEWNMYEAFPKVLERYLASDSTESNRAMTIHALVTEYLSNLVETDRAVRKVPYLSMNLQAESTEILLQIARDFQRSKNQFLTETKLADIEEQSIENLQTVLDGQDQSQIDALEISRQKAISLGDISARKRDDIDVEIDKVQVAITKLEKTSLNIENEVRSVTKDFEGGAKRRQVEAYVEVAMAVTSTVISFFSGGFDPNKVAKAVQQAKNIATKLKKIFKVMSLIKKLLKKLKDIKNILMKVKGFVSSRIGKLVGNLKKIKNMGVLTIGKNILKKAGDAYDRLATPIAKELKDETVKDTKRFWKRSQRMQDVAEGLMAVNMAKKSSDAGFDPLNGFKPGEPLKALNEAKSLDVSDVVQWDLTRDQIEGLLDASLSAEVPETTSYKAALLKFTSIGKAITQLQIDEAKLGNDYAAADFTYLKHVEDYEVIDNTLTKVKEGMEKRKEDDNLTLENMQEQYENMYSKRERNLFWEEFINKMQLVSSNIDFCNAYSYFHLETCPPELQFNVLDTLERITQVQTQLLFYSKKELENLYPPPQTFYNISMVFQKENNCNCVHEPMDTLNKTFPEDRDFLKFPPEAIATFYSSSISGCFPDRSEPYSQKDKEDVMQKLLECDMKRIESFKKETSMSWSIPINADHLFLSYERVRIDQIQVYLHGAKTKSGVITVGISNAGVSEDRYRGRVFKFYGEPWLREFSYYKESNTIGRSGTHDENEKASIVVSTEVHKHFDGVFRIPTGFSTWTIEVPQEKNAGLDLSGLKYIEVIYSGSFIVGSTDYTKYTLEGYPQITEVVEEEEQPSDDSSVKKKNKMVFSLKHKRKRNVKHGKQKS